MSCTRRGADMHMPMAHIVLFMLNHPTRVSRRIWRIAVDKKRIKHTLFLQCIYSCKQLRLMTHDKQWAFGRILLQNTHVQWPQCAPQKCLIAPLTSVAKNVPTTSLSSAPYSHTSYPLFKTRSLLSLSSVWSLPKANCFPLWGCIII